MAITTIDGGNSVTFLPKSTGFVAAIVYVSFQANISVEELCWE
jgi:hypothetical protein